MNVRIPNLVGRDRVLEEVTRGLEGKNIDHDNGNEEQGTKSVITQFYEGASEDRGLMVIGLEKGLVVIKEERDEVVRHKIIGLGTLN